MGKGATSGSMRATAVEVRDTNGDTINVLTEEGFQTYLENILNERINSLISTQQEEIIKQLKQINLHLYLMTETCFMDVDD